jgi:two-component system CheB/CheR fusion protein
MSEPDDAGRELERLRAHEERLCAENEHLLETGRLLEESRDRYAELYELTPVPGLTLDDGGVIRGANVAAAAFFGWDRRYLVGLPLRTLVAPECRPIVGAHLAACRFAHEVVVSELRIVTREDAHVLVRLSSRRLPGRDEALATTVQDLTEQERALAERNRLTEREREARASSEAKDQFIAMLSHELRTPLTPVLAAVSALERREGLPEWLKNVFAMISRNVEAESRLIDDLLDATRIARGKMNMDRRPMELHGAVRAALDLLGHQIAKKRLTIVVELEAAEAWVDGDLLRLRQVFSNLLQNAIKFTPAGGRIELRSWNRDAWLAVELGDSGIGIDRDALPRLFVPFEQVIDPTAPDASSGRGGGGQSRGGLGLGLAICKGLVELHGGRIAATSPGLGKGSRFIVDLPACPAPPERAASAAVAAPSPGPMGKPRILLVEDDADTAEALADLLRMEGFPIRVASSFHAALAANVADCDLLVCDLGLGDGNGLELMRRLREKGPIKGIVLSGFGTESDIRASRDAGFSAHLIKPVSLEKLVSAIGRLHVAHPPGGMT